MGAVAFVDGAESREVSTNAVVYGSLVISAVIRGMVPESKSMSSMVYDK